MTFWLIVALGACIGLLAGLLGAGGSALTVLLFLDVVGLDLESAIATGLAVIAVTSIVAVTPYAFERSVLWRSGLGFSIASMIGAYLGGRLSTSLPRSVLMAIFVSTMVTAAVAMLVKRDRPRRHERPSKWQGPTLAGAGLFIGTLTGTVGLGGGYAVVPLLVVLLGAPMRSAVGTSLMVIALNAIAGLAGRLPHPLIDWHLAVPVGLAASLGGLAGTWLGKRVEARALRRAFAVLLLAGSAVQLAGSVFLG